MNRLDNYQPSLCFVIAGNYKVEILQGQPMQQYAPAEHEHYMRNTENTFETAFGKSKHRFFIVSFLLSKTVIFPNNPTHVRGQLIYEFYIAYAPTEYMTPRVAPQMPTLAQLAQEYWICDAVMRSEFHTPATWEESLISFKPRLSKNEINLELLKEFPYEAIDVKSPEDGTMSTIYKCKVEGCDKEFGRTWNMLDHARTHKGVKPFQCKWCTRSFTQKGNLKKHLKQHLEPTLNQRKKFKCQFCSSRYTEKYNYNVSQQPCQFLYSLKLN